MLETELTHFQKQTLDLMWSTQTVAKVNRLYLEGDQAHIVPVERPTRPIDFAVDPHEFALKLHEKNPYDPLSPYYVNLRNLPGHLNVSIAETIAEATRDLDFDYYTGIPNAADAFAQIYGSIRVPQPEYRKLLGKAVTGQGRKIIAHPDTPLGEGGGVLLMDDLITEADTKFEAIEVAEGLDYRVIAIAVLIDRQQGGKELLEAKGYTVRAPILISNAFVHYYRTGRINYSKYSNSMDYLNEARSRTGLAKLELITP